jgi:hypothetical protein
VKPLLIVCAALGLMTAAGPMARAGPAQVAETPHQRAVDEVNHLLAKAPVLAGATEVSTAPVKQLASPPQRWTFSSTVVRERFWTIEESSDTAYDQLTAHLPSGLTQASTGSVGGPTFSESYVVDSPIALPAGIDDAELELVVSSTGPNETAIGVYALAAPEPNRHPSEILPTATHRAKVEVRVGAHVRRSHLVTGPAARKLAADFNALRVPPIGGSYSCPAASAPVRRIVVTFFFGGHRLRASDSVASCGFVEVQRGGRRLPGLFEDRAFDHDVHTDLGL